MTLPPNLPALRLLTVVLVVGVLWWAQDVVVPIVVSLLVSYALEPAVARLQAWHVRRRFAAPVLITVLIARVLGGAYAIRGEATAFAERLPGVAHELARGMRSRMPGNAGAVARMPQAGNEPG